MNDTHHGQKEVTDDGKRRRTLRETLNVYGFGILIVAVAFMVAYQFVEPAPPTSLTIASGSVHGAYFKFANRYRDLLAQDGITLNVIQTSGSVENLQLLRQGKVDAAFVQSGIGNPKEFPGLLGLGSLYFEPLWVFCRLQPVPNRLLQLAGKRVAIGPAGSGTRAIARQLLSANHITLMKGDFSELSGLAAADALKARRIDALFITASSSSPTVQKLLMMPGVHPLSFSRAAAYTMRYPFLSQVDLPEGAVDLATNVPDHLVHLVAPAATLVVRQELHPALAGLLIQVAARIHRNLSLIDSRGHEFPSADFIDFPLSEEAEHFYRFGPPFLQRYLPFWAAILIDRLKIMLLPLLALLLPLMRILPLTYRWRMRSRIYRWYDELQVADATAHEKASPEIISASLKTLDDVEEEVRHVSVPLSYAAELYILRQHIDMLKNQLNGLLTGGADLS